ncbi:MAG TPA: fumarylacetoacetate hydrolase family protein [Chloroflexota bacterium]|nr:fumarylacetoacetate hydrolase family protein [Chloroflexota bacterium]
MATSRDAVPFRLASLRTAAGIRAAVAVENQVHELPPRWHDLPAESVLALLQQWDRAFPAIQAAVARGESFGAQTLPVAEARFAAPILYPRKLLMAGVNYVDHVHEMQGHRPDKTNVRPFAFLKATEGCLIGPGEAILCPAGEETLDWEGELGVVIGRPARNVPASAAYDYIAGYTICNDVTSRARSRRDDIQFRYDWYASKSCDTFGPMGPYLVPRQFVPDPENLHLVTTVNGEAMQDSNTRFLLFNIAELVEFLTRDATLLPGDVISTGTPSGVGMGRGRFLQPGDVVAVEIEGLGRLENPVR